MFIYMCIDVKLQFHVLSRERTSLFFRFVVLSPFDSRKSDGGNTLHVATICLATQLFLLIVDFQQYFCHIECDDYDVENQFG